ncbi:MAG: alpha amylase C-terminal domain-containing protein [Phycisphaerae bacterium]
MEQAVTYSNYMQAFKDMIALRTSHPALRSTAGYQINHLNDSDDILGMHRWNVNGDVLLVVIGLNNSDKFNYHIGFPQAGVWREVFNSQASVYGGTGLGNGGMITTTSIIKDGYANSAFITVPKMSVIVFQWSPEDVNLDGTSDLYDMALFQRCVAGGSDCSVDADFDNDSNVDADDWAYVGPRVLGPGQ